MIRLVTVNTRGVRPELLPPERPDGRLRLLLVTLKYTGLRSIGLEFEKFCAQRDDIDCVSILYHPPTWLKVAAYPVPRAPLYDFSAERVLAGWRLYTRRWYGGPIPLRRFDAVHCTQQFMAPAVLDRRPPGLVVSVHIDATAWNTVDEWGDSMRWSRPVIRSEERVFREADLIASTGEWVNESLARRYGIGRDKIVAAPPTSDLVPRPDLDPAAPIPDRKPRILFIGHSFVRKGGELLLKLHQERFRDRAELHIVSKERTGPPMPGVVWHGSVERQKLLSEILPNCDLMCMPTQRDMSPWVSVEAQAGGLPVVLPRLAGIPDLVDHGRTGLLVEPGDDRAYGEAIEHLISDRARCREMGRAAQAWVRERFTREVVFGRIVDAMKAAKTRKQA